MFAVPEHTVLRRPPHRPLTPTALVRAVTADPPRWRELLSRASSGPLPLPVDDPRASVWLSVWLPGETGPTERYDGAQGAFAVLSGVITEHAGGSDRTLRPGQVRVFGPGYRHSVSNPGAEAAVTVHVQIM